MKFSKVQFFFPGNTSPTIADLSFTAQEKGILSFLGPSGCGKSTILRLAAGLLKPASGQIESKTSNPGSLGFVFQDSELLPWLTLEQNAKLPSRLSGKILDEARLEKFLYSLGLGAAKNKYPAELSGGMKMRASLARSLSLNPSLLLLDEPFAALDELIRYRLQEDLRRYQQEQGFTALFVTHSIAEAIFLSDEILILGPGSRILDRHQVKGPALREEKWRQSQEYFTQLNELTTRFRQVNATGASI